MLSEKCRNLLSDDHGGGTIMGLFWFMLLVGITGLAVDTTDGLRNKTMLQATADASALAGAIKLPVASAAVATAISYSDSNMPVEEYGDVLQPGDVEVGTWDPSTHSFSAGGLLPDAVRVRLHQTVENANAVPVNFLRIIGLTTWDVKVEAVAQRFIPECLKDGLVARGIVDISSNNTFVKEICLHGQQGVEMQNHNYFESGVNVSMPNVDTQLTIPTGGMTSNPGLPEALRENRLDPRMVNHIEEIMAQMLDPKSAIIPSYIDKTKPVIVVDDKFDLSTAQPGRIYHVDCKANKTAAIPSNTVTSKVVIIAECELSIGSGAKLFDMVLGSRSGGNKKTENANIGLAANVQLGLPDSCAPGGGVLLLSNATIHTAASTQINGVQMVAKGDVDLGAADLGINGISVQTGGNITMTSNNQFGLCAGGAPNLFTVNYYRLVR